MAETGKEKLDALGLIQEEMYAEIADFIVRNSVIRAIGLDDSDVSRNFWLSFNDNQEIDEIFYHHLERLGRTAEFEHADKFESLFGGTDVIDFKRIYTYREDDFGCTDSSEASLDRAKKLLIPLIEEEIPTQKLICMLCYCETHKQYNGRLFEAYEQLLFSASNNRKNNRCCMMVVLQYDEDGKEIVNSAKKVCKEKIDEWYKEIFESNVPIAIFNYTLEEFRADYIKYCAKWFNESPIKSKKMKRTLDPKDKYIKIVKEGLIGWELDILSPTGKYGGLSNYIINFIDACGFDNIFELDYHYMYIPKVVFKETILTLAHMKEQKYFGLKERWSNINTKDALRTFGNMYFLYLCILQILSKLKPDWCIDFKLQIQKSLANSSVPLYLSAYICLITTEEPGDNYIMQAVQGKVDISNFNKKEINAPFRVSNFQVQLPQSEHIDFVNWLHSSMK